MPCIPVIFSGLPTHLCMPPYGHSYANHSPSAIIDGFAAIAPAFMRGPPPPAVMQALEDLERPLRGETFVQIKQSKPLTVLLALLDSAGPTACSEPVAYSFCPPSSHSALAPTAPSPPCLFHACSPQQRGEPDQDDPEPAETGRPKPQSAPDVIRVCGLHVFGQLRLRHHGPWSLGRSEPDVRKKNQRKRRFGPF